LPQESDLFPRAELFRGLRVPFSEFRSQRLDRFMGIILTTIIGLVAGPIAKLVVLGDDEPVGFVLTTVVGIADTFLASYLGQSLGWCGPAKASALLELRSVPSSF
jgi:uncharacterized membrane protein YeaQ/YmgE (transglycosylase-associated protein family)